MAEIKWVKLTTDMFDNRKIKHLRRLPEGNNIVLLWVMLLTMAGRCNAGGMIFLTENIPYTSKMLADELEEKMGKEGVPRLREEGYKDGRWIVLDFGDVLVHIFHKDERAFYNIERLWMDPTNCEHYGTEVG